MRVCPTQSTLDHILHDTTGAFTVAVVGSDPMEAGSLSRDDYGIGGDCSTEAEAEATYQRWIVEYPGQFVVLVARDAETRQSRHKIHPPSWSDILARQADLEADRQAAWVQETDELAREAGMLGGCDAYNDAMGY